MPKAISAVWSLFVHEKTRDVRHLQPSSSTELLDALKPSNSTDFPVLDGKFVFRQKTHESAEGRAPYLELARLIFCINWRKNRTGISSLTKISLKIILDAKIKSASGDVNTIYRPITLKLTLVDGILSNVITSAISFPSLNMNWAVPFSFLQQFFAVVVTLSSLLFNILWERT